MQEAWEFQKVCTAREELLSELALKKWLEKRQKQRQAAKQKLKSTVRYLASKSERSERSWSWDCWGELIGTREILQNANWKRMFRENKLLMRIDDSEKAKLLNVFFSTTFRAKSYFHSACMLQEINSQQGMANLDTRETASVQIHWVSPTRWSGSLPDPVVLIVMPLPIFKRGKKNGSGNYKIVRFTSSSLKDMEHIVRGSQPWKISPVWAA